jgi:nucleotide-binding universal stress UspA family protein
VNRSEGRGWIRRLFDRVAETAAFSAALPVLVLNSGHEEELAKSGNGILFAVDPGNAPSGAELEYVARTARLMSAEVHVLHVRPKRGPLAQALGRRPPSGGGAAVMELWRIEACLRARGACVRSAMVTQGEPIAASIERHAATHRACLTVVTSPARPCLKRFFLGSVARQLLRISKRPVFVLRAESRWPGKSGAEPRATPAPLRRNGRKNGASGPEAPRNPAQRGKVA